VNDEALMRAYKLLEFFDTLALHFQLHGDGLRDDGRFPKVPTGGNDGDLPVSLTMLDAATACLSPYPFDTPSYRNDAPLVLASFLLFLLAMSKSS
jgi:hypothetical protein